MTDKPAPQDDQQQDDQDMVVETHDGRQFRVGDNWKRITRIDPYGDHEIETPPSACSTVDLVNQALSTVGPPPWVQTDSRDLLDAASGSMQQISDALSVPGTTPINPSMMGMMNLEGDLLKTAAAAHPSNLMQQWQESIDRMTGGWMEQLQDTINRLEESMSSLLRRNRDRAVRYITDDHVRDAVERIDWATFVAAQREGSDDPDDDLIGRLEATLQDDDRQDVRDAIARELLLITWSHTAWDLKYDGDQTQTLEWEDPETGDVIEHVATPEDVTVYMFREYLDTPDHWRDFADEYVERDILEALLQTIPKPATISIPAYAPAFRDGVGHVLTDGIARTFRSRAVGPWDPDEHEWPILRGNWGKTGSHLAGDVLFTVDQTHIDDRDQAWSLVGKIDDADMDVLDYVLAKWVANRGSLGDLDGVHFTAKEMLEAWGIKPHHKGGYRPQQYATVASSVSRLMHIGVASRVWVKPAGRGSRKPEPREIYVPLLRGGPGMRDPRYSGRRGAREWVIDPKGWALVYGDMTPQHGRMLQTILQLDPNTDRNIKRIARYLLGIFRIRKGATGQAYRIDTLLGESCVEIDTNQPTRFRTRIEGAMDHLQTIGMVSSWRYLDDVPAKGSRGMLDQWLASRIEIIPSPAAVGKVIETPRRGRRAIATS